MTKSSSPWKNLFSLAAWSTLLLIAYSLVTMLLLLMVGGQPESARQNFEMLAENRLAGIMRLDLLTVLVMPLYYLLFLAFFAALKKNHLAIVSVASLLGCAGVTLFLATPSVFSWLILADKFAAASDEAQKTMLLAAGEAILASDMWHGTGALMGGLLIQFGMLVVSLLMLQTDAFGKFTALVGVGTHGLDFLHILVGFFLPGLGAALLFIAGPLYLIWLPLLARDFFRLAKDMDGKAAKLITRIPLQ